jgi:hypothetical protein
MIGITERVNTETVNKVFASLRAMLDERERALKQQILDIERENKNQLDNYQTKLRSNKLVFDLENRAFESIVSAKDDIKLLQVKEQLTGCLQQITQELNKLKPPIKTEYEIKGIDQLQTFVGNILKQNVIIIQTPGNVLQNNLCLRAHFLRLKMSKGRHFGIHLFRHTFMMDGHCLLGYTFE